MKSYCGADCTSCGFKEKCSGCVETEGCPFGKQCFIAKYIKLGGMENFLEFKKQLIDEFNDLGILGMPKIDELYALNSSFVNLEYTLPSGEKVKLLDESSIYLGNQVENIFSQETERCFGLVAGMDFILVSEYGLNGENAEIVVYKKR